METLPVPGQASWKVQTLHLGLVSFFFYFLKKAPKFYGFKGASEKRKCHFCTLGKAKTRLTATALGTAPSCFTLPSSLQGTPLGDRPSVQGRPRPLHIHPRGCAGALRRFVSSCLPGGGAQRQEALCPPAPRNRAQGRAGRHQLVLPPQVPGAGAQPPEASALRSTSLAAPARPSPGPGWAEAAVAVPAAPELWCSILVGEPASAAGPPLPSPLVSGRPEAPPHPWQQCLSPPRRAWARQPHSTLQAGPALPSRKRPLDRGRQAGLYDANGAAGGARPGLSRGPPDHTTHFSKETEGRVGAGGPLCFSFFPCFK